MVTTVTDLQSLLDIIARTGFVLFFAVWTVWRLDTYLGRLIEETHRQCDELRKLAGLLERLIGGQDHAAALLAQHRD